MTQEDNITFFAETNFRNQRSRFGIKSGDRRRHMYIIGKTGVGKTTLLENMAIQDIQAGRGLGIVDPHGEFAEKMLDFVPSHRINDVIYFNPADLDYPIAFNALEKVDPEHRHLVASGLVGVFKKLWAETWGPRLEYVLRNAIMALLEYPGSTLLGIMRMLVDKEYRNRVTAKITDPVVKSFWVDEFSKYPDRFMAEAVAPIQNKVGQFLTNPLIRNIVGQTKSAINIREAMDSGKIFIINLSKGKIGEDTSALMGAMLITRLQLAAMSRVDVPEEERRDFYLYVDEFQNFATESFANILSEARKYRLNLILAHQYIGQLIHGENPIVRDAIFGNVGTTIVFRVGASDAEFLEPEFSPEFNINDLVNLGFAEIYLKLMIDGFSSRPFSAVTLSPFLRLNGSQAEKIIRVSRERYGRSRQEVEEKIARWSGVIEAEEGERWGQKEEVDSPKEGRLQEKSTRQIFIENCSNCGKKTELSFKPDGVRPVYCKECLVKVGRPSAGPSAFLRTSPSVSLRTTGRPTGEVLIRETGQPISLAEVARKEPTKPSFSKKTRKEVNLGELRGVLQEVLREKPLAEGERLARQAGEDIVSERVWAAGKNVSDVSDNNADNNKELVSSAGGEEDKDKKKSLKPGEAVDL